MRVPTLLPLVVLLAACTSPAPSGSADDDGGSTTDGGATGDGGSTTDDGGVVDDTGDGGDGGDGGGDDTGIAPTPLGIDAVVEANPANAFSAFVTVTVDGDAQAWVEYGEGAFTHNTPTVAVREGQATRIQVLGLRADRDFQLRVVAQTDIGQWTGDTLHFETEPLPSGWPVCTPHFTADETSFDPDEVTCAPGATSTGDSMFHCTDYWGETVFAVQIDSNDSLVSMRPLMDGGWASTSTTSSKLMVFDADGTVRSQFYPGEIQEQSRFVHEVIDSHEVLQLTEGEWAGAVAFITQADETLSDGSWKNGNGIVVMDPNTGEVFYDYSFHGASGDDKSMDDLLPYTRAGNGDYPEDWTHANSLLHGLDADGRQYFLLSLRSQDWVVKLYPDNDTLAWALGYQGSFTLVDDIDAVEQATQSPLEWAYHQHGLQFVEDGPLYAGVDGRIHLMMLDNGFPRRDRTGYRWDLTYSRVVQFELDPATQQAELEFSWGSTEPGGEGWFFTQACGGTQLTDDPGRVIFSTGETATRVELAYPEGEERWRMTCQTRDFCEYRVQWFPSLYETDWAYD